MTILRVLLLFTLIAGFTDDGTGIDPHGGVRATSDSGGGMDPNG